MKKWFVLVLAALLLGGCGAQPTFETVDDDDLLPVSGQIKQIELELPKEAAQPVCVSDNGDRLYLCSGYTLMIQTLPGGNLDSTLRQISGFDTQQLRPVHTKTGEADRYDFVWTAAGEGADQVLRSVVLDDGQNHHVVTVVADATDGGNLQETWNQLLSTVSLRTD